MYNSYFAFLLISLVYFLPCSGQNDKVKRFDLQAMLEKSELRAVNRMVSPLSDDPSKKGIRLSELQGPGIVWLKNSRFSSGVIEFDVKGKDEYQKSFVGIAFHGVSDTT